MRSARCEADAQIKLDWGRLLWRCRRGMKELDIILERYTRSAHGRAGPTELRAFAALLELPDPELAAYLFGHAAPGDPELAKLARRIGCGVCATGGGG
jgi:antitoxin CptB